MSDELKAQARAVLDGIGSPKWRAFTTGVTGGDHWYICNDDESVAMVSASDGEDEELRQPRAEFIAAAPDLVRGLLAALEAAEAQREIYRDALMASAEVGGKAIRERDEARAAIERATAVADEAEWNSTRWEDPLPVPEWVGRIKKALGGGA